MVVSITILRISFIFSGVSTFVFKSKANTLVSALRKRFLFHCYRLVICQVPLEFYQCVRKWKTPSVESVSSLCFSRYSSTSFLIPSNYSMLSILGLVSICSKPNRFSDASVVYMTDGIF